MWTMIFGLLSGIPGLAGKWFDYQQQKNNVTLDGFKTASGVDLAAYQAHLSALVEINRMKMAQNQWWGAKLIILVAGVPCAAHLAAIMLDSFPFPFLAWDSLLPHWTTHVVGSWGIPKPPAPYDTYEWAIVQSFFIVMPVMTVTSAVSQWLNRK